MLSDARREPFKYSYQTNNQYKDEVFRATHGYPLGKVSMPHKKREMVEYTTIFGSKPNNPRQQEN